MAKFNNRIVCRWRDISNRFEGVSTQQHAHEAFAFISNVLTRSADIFPKGDRRRSKWDECCQSLLEINEETHRAAIREKDCVPSLRKLFQTVEHEGHRMYQLLHSIEDDGEREVAINQWEPEMCVAFQNLVYAAVARWCPDRQASTVVTFNLGKQGADSESTRHYPMEKNKCHKKYGSNP